MRAKGLPEGRASHRAWLATTALVAAAATAVLASQVWVSGVDVTWKDPRQFLGTAWSLLSGDGLVVSSYRVAEDSVVQTPLTHFPPMTSLVYAGLAALGVPFSAVPSVLALIAWPALLALLAATTYRLTASPGLTVLATLWTGLTWPFYEVYTASTTEALFLPQVALAGYLLTDLPRSSAAGRGRLYGAAAVLALLPLTRYSGMFLFGAAVLWWGMLRLVRGEGRRLRHELPVLAAAALPLAVWLLRNLALSGGLFGPAHLGGSVDGFTDGFLGVAEQSTWPILPAVRPGPVYRELGTAALIAAVAVPCFLCLLAVPRLRTVLETARELTRRSPLAAMLAAYLALYTLAQPIVRFRPLDARDATTALVLGYPLLFALAGALPRRRVAGALAAQAAVSVLLLAALLVGGSGGGPLPGADLADRPSVAAEGLLAGHPTWLVSRPPRLHDRRRYHPGVEELLETLPRGAAVVSNAPDLFPDRPVLADDSPVDRWLEAGRCRGRTPVLLVVFDWDVWRGEASIRGRRAYPDPARLRRAVEAACPHLEPISLDHATAYLAPVSGPE